MSRAPRSAVGTLAAALLTSLFVLSGASAFAAPSGAPAGIPVESRAASPEQRAEVAYQRGLKHKSRAERAAGQAAAADAERKRTRFEQRAEREWGRAREAFTEVLQQMPEHFRAANELGYALRQQGHIKDAIGAYNHALKIHPDFLPAIEYRAQAALRLGFYDTTREAYLRLFREDGALAADLMTAMQNWAEEQVEPDAPAREFLDWLAERKRLAILGEAGGGLLGSSW